MEPTMHFGKNGIDASGEGEEAAAEEDTAAEDAKAAE